MQQLLDCIFEPVELEDYSRIYRYTSAYGEGSCQHSPVSMYSLSEKYADCICERDGFLYTLRSRLCDETYRVYLAPLGGGDIKAAFERLLTDAGQYGKKVKFLSLTARTAAALEEALPGRFAFQEDRDLAEYLYRADVMAAFSGGALRRRRTQIHNFWKQFGSRASIADICPANFPEVLAFAQKWLELNRETHDAHTLEREARMVENQIRHWDALRLSGVILRLDGETGGICYGTRLNDQVFDVIIEKADRRIPHSYKVLRQEATKRCVAETGCKYINLEEDVGVPGLRELKCGYKPDNLLRKFIATEREFV